MSALRRHIHLFAAIVLLAWLFACGAARAQACTSHAHGLTDECCTSMQVSAARVDASSDALLPALSSESWLPAAAHAAVPAALPSERRHLLARGPVRTDSGQRIPIVFLRLAL